MFLRKMAKNLLWGVVIFSLLFVGCNKLSEPSSPTGPINTGINDHYFTGVGDLTLTVEPTKGTAPLNVMVTVTITTTANVPLAGNQVTITSTSGFFPNYSKTITLTTDSDGKVETVLNDVTLDGTIVTASWSHYKKTALIDINNRPVANLVVTPNAMSAGTSVTFRMDASASHDPEDGNNITYSFNAGCTNASVTVGAITPGDNNTPIQFVTIGGQTAAERPVAGDVVVFSVTITDTEGATDIAVVSITVS